MSDRPVVARGEVWMVALDPVVGSEQAKTRPCVVIQRDALHKAGQRTTVVVPFTDARGRVLSVVNPLVLAGEGGLTKDCVALCQHVRVVDRLRMRGVTMGSLTAAAMNVVEVGLIELLDLAAHVDDP